MNEYRKLENQSCQAIEVKIQITCLLFVDSVISEYNWEYLELELFSLQKKKEDDGPLDVMRIQANYNVRGNQW